MSGPNCKPNELVMVKTSCPNPNLHGHFGTTVRFLGNLRLPCCGQVHANVWLVELATSVETRCGPMRHFGLADEDLKPIRPGPDAIDEDTTVPTVGVTA